MSYSKETPNPLLIDPIEALVRRKSGGMMIGMLGIMMFFLVDSWFISMLGTEALAAMSYIIPVCFIVTCVIMGIGKGMSAIVGRLLGAQQNHQANRIVTDSLSLSLILLAILITIGFFTIESLFSFLGANQVTLPYVVDYMQAWYIGVFFLTIPMVGNAAIRSTGNMRLPATVMILSGLINAVLDPIFIFILDMGMQGAAIASAVAWIIASVMVSYMLQVKLKLIDWSWPGMNHILNNWSRVLKISIPTAISQMVNPLAQGILVWLLSSFGLAGVAAFGIGMRIESTLLIIAMSLSLIVPTVFGQNYGAGLNQRASQSILYSIRLIIYVYVLIYLILWPLSPIIATVFSEDQEVIDVAVAYLRIVPLSYAMIGLSQLTSSFLLSLHKPILSLMINLIPLLVITIPAALLGAEVAGIRGILWGVCLSQITIGAVLYWYILGLLKNVESEQHDVVMST